MSGKAGAEIKRVLKEHPELIVFVAQQIHAALQDAGTPDVQVDEGDLLGAIVAGARDLQHAQTVGAKTVEAARVFGDSLVSVLQSMVVKRGS